MAHRQQTSMAQQTSEDALSMHVAAGQQQPHPLQEDYQHELTKFQHACLQLEILNRKVTELLQRHYHAAHHLALKRSLQLQIVTTEGVRNMFLQYCAHKAEELDMILDLIEGRTVEFEEEDEEEEEEASRLDSDTERMDF